MCYNYTIKKGKALKEDAAMVKLYEVKVEKIDAYYGAHVGWEHVTYVLGEEKAKKVCEEVAAKIKTCREW